MKKNKILISALWLSVGVFSMASQAADYTNSIGIKFKNISAGSFYMGSCKLTAADNAANAANEIANERANKKRKFMGMAALPAKTVKAVCPSGGTIDNDANDGETPQHKVRISKAFQMGVYEVTLGQFKKYIASSGSDSLISDDFIKYNSNGEAAAVTHVSWHDAQDFIKWLNKKEGGSHYSLPTEAQWEYAARAGTSSIYSWGNSSSQAGSYAWYSKNAYDIGRAHAHKVGTKKPNPWGLYDMHGNVWEWVQDGYDEKYYRNSSASTDPIGASSGRYRVARGGSWDNNAGLMRSASRGSDSPGYRDLNLGFRLVRKP